MPSGPPLGVVLTGGRATRLRPLSASLPKALIPLLNRPLIAYSLEMLASAGIEEIVVVVGKDDDRTGDVARQCAPMGVRVSITVQQTPHGSGDALISAGAVLDGRTVVVAAVDTVLRGELRPHVEAFRADPEAVAWVVVHETDRPREMGIVVLDGNRATYFEEKPADPPSNLALVGIWMLAPAVIERLRTHPTVTARGEVELTHEIALMRHEGHAVGGSVFEGDWLDTGMLRSLLDTQRALLDEAGITSLVADDAVIEDSEIGENVVVGAGAVLRRVHLTDALVAPGAVIEDLDAKSVVITVDGEVAPV
jgi:glucose-1-phosphate thymidylyltransferase